MKRLKGRPFDQWRQRSIEVLKHYGNEGDETCGVFRVPCPSGSDLYVIASQGMGWDHVSVSHQHRTPTWAEMSYIKRAFFKRDEWAVEYHPPEKENLSLHDYCLHLWRPNDGIAIPLPAPIMVAPPNAKQP